MDEAENKKKQEEDQNELLVWACARGLLEDAMELVAVGADAAFCDKLGRRPLHYAAAHGHADVLRYLTSHGVDADADDARGRTALHYAALGGHAEAVKALSGKQGRCWVDAYDADSNTPLHLAARGFGTPTVLSPAAAAVAAKGGMGCGGAAEREELLPEEERLALGTRVDVFGVAQQQERSGPTIHALVAAGAKLEVTNNQGLTPLGAAVVTNNAPAVTALLRDGARPTVLARKFSLLHLAAGLGHPQCLERLLEGAPSSAVAKSTSAAVAQSNAAAALVNMFAEGLTALHAAAMACSMPCAVVLLKHGADPAATTPTGLLPADLVPMDFKPTTAPGNTVCTSSSTSSKLGKDKHPTNPQDLQALLRDAAASAAAQHGRSSGSGNSCSGNAPLPSSMQRQQGEAGPQQAGAGRGQNGTGSKEQQQQKQQQQQQQQQQDLQQKQRRKQQPTYDDPTLEPLQQRFEKMSEQERIRKVDTYARMSDAEVAELPYMPPSVLPLLKQLKRAHNLLACWQPVAALRSDPNLQADLEDTRLRMFIEELQKPGVDISRYRLDSQVQSVLTKLGKLHAVLREHGQGLKVALADLRATPYGPNSTSETNRQLRQLEERVVRTRQQVIDHILKGGHGEAEEDAQQQQEQEGGAGAQGVRGGSVNEQGAKREGPPADLRQQQQQQQQQLPEAMGKASSNKDAGRAAVTKGGEAPQGEVGSSGSPPEADSFEQALREAMGKMLEVEGAEQGEVPSWGAVGWAFAQRMGKHLARILVLAMVFILAMTMLGLMPDQLQAKARLRKEALAAQAAAARASGADLLLEGRARDAGPGECRTGRCPSRKGQQKTAYNLAEEDVQDKKRRRADALRQAEAKIEGGELEGLWDEDDEGESPGRHQEL
ncbi:hypothetical protein DUNSADRAFT_6525 [Dunaliella salina]|uniref:Uncharacterized protein n=1 Tax=Dunaliella salina TaxID=3046 RepID=A0ABQ7GN68_DUNSA|nr:hypothetical protein DUNSADRAFT_6525 [Dunaliella salina]|eukprot:KAF5836055.1 hypothetical protein DUNSADRAFT_6525 [Dunaliella salina]